MSYQSQKTGLFSWSKSKQDPLLLCCGTINPENQQQIEIFRFDPFNKKNHFQNIGKFGIYATVNCITWEENEKFEMGLISVALNDGALLILNPKKIIDYQIQNEEPKEDCIVSNFDLYENEQFFCMEYNNFKKGLLATGGSQLYIVNFEKGFETPDIFCPYQVEENGRIFSSLSWNKSKAVQHILAAAQDNGKIYIIDLKLKKSICSFDDGKLDEIERAIYMVWNPKIPTQLAVAFDHQESGLQIWDLRNSKTPYKILNNFGQVNSIDWNLSQQNQIVFSNKQNQIYLYNYDNDQIIHQIQLSYEVLYLKFLPCLNDSFYGGSIEGDLFIETLQQKQLEDISIQNAPFWIQNQESNFVSQNGKGHILQGNDILIIENNQQQTYQQKLNELEDNVFNKNNDEYLNYLKTQDYHDKYLLNLLQNWGENQNQKLQSLDINIDSLIEQTETITGYTYKKQDVKQQVEQKRNFAEISENDASDFFANLAKENDNEESNKKDKEIEILNQITADTFIKPQPDELIEVSYLQNTNWNKGLEQFIKKNIIMDNYEGALDCAIKANRIFEAFLIAYSNPNNREHYIEYVVEKFSLSYSDEFLSKFLKPLTQQKYEDIVNSYQVEDWKDILTFIVKNVKNESEKENLFLTLIQRLQREQKNDIINYILLFKEQTNEFLSNIESQLLNDSSFKNLQKNFELLLYLCRKLGIKLQTNQLTGLFRFCNILLDQGFVKLAYEFMEGIANDNETVVKQYLARLQHYYLHLFAFKPQIQISKKQIVFPTKKIVKTQQTGYQKRPLIKTDNKLPNKPRLNIFSDQKNQNVLNTQKQNITPPVLPNNQRQVNPIQPPLIKKPKQKQMMPPPIKPPVPKVNNPQNVQLTKPPQQNITRPPMPPQQNNSRPPLPPQQNISRPPLPPKQNNIQPPMPPKQNINQPPMPPKQNINQPPMPPKQNRNIPQPPQQNTQQFKPQNQTVSTPNMPPPPPQNNKMKQKKSHNMAPPPRPMTQMKYNYDMNQQNTIIDFLTKANDFVGQLCDNQNQENEMKQILSQFLQQVNQRVVPNNIMEAVFELSQMISQNQCQQAVQYALSVIPQNSGQFGKILETLKCIAEALC